VGFYRKFVLPTLIDRAMKDAAVIARRSELIPQATGSVLEIGIGSGLNLPFYSASVTDLRGVDPSAELLAMARKKIAHVGFPVDLTSESAERLSLESKSIDTVVTTWTLCSIPNPLQALQEMRRVLNRKGICSSSSTVFRRTQGFMRGSTASTRSGGSSVEGAI